jgi:hypothetical protein
LSYEVDEVESVNAPLASVAEPEPDYDEQEEEEAPRSREGSIADMVSDSLAFPAVVADTAAVEAPLVAASQPIDEALSPARRGPAVGRVIRPGEPLDVRQSGDRTWKLWAIGLGFVCSVLLGAVIVLLVKRPEPTPAVVPPTAAIAPPLSALPAPPPSAVPSAATKAAAGAQAEAAPSASAEPEEPPEAETPVEPEPEAAPPKAPAPKPVVRRKPVAPRPKPRPKKKYIPDDI